MAGWGGRRSRIVVVVLEECRVVIDGFICSAKNICARCRKVDKIIVGSLLNILPGFLQLEVHCLKCKGDRSRDMGDDHTVIVEDSVEHCVWVYIHV